MAPARSSQGQAPRASQNKARKSTNAKTQQSSSTSGASNSTARKSRGASRPSSGKANAPSRTVKVGSNLHQAPTQAVNGLNHHQGYTSSGPSLLAAHSNPVASHPSSGKINTSSNTINVEYQRFDAPPQAINASTNHLGNSTGSGGRKSVVHNTAGAIVPPFGKTNAPFNTMNVESDLSQVPTTPTINNGATDQRDNISRGSRASVDLESPAASPSSSPLAHYPSRRTTPEDYLGRPAPPAIEGSDDEGDNSTINGPNGSVLDDKPTKSREPAQVNYSQPINGTNDQGHDSHTTTTGLPSTPLSIRQKRKRAIDDIAQRDEEAEQTRQRELWLWQNSLIDGLDPEQQQQQQEEEEEDSSSSSSTEVHEQHQAWLIRQSELIVREREASGLLLKPWDPAYPTATAAMQRDEAIVRRRRLAVRHEQIKQQLAPVKKSGNNNNNNKSDKSSRVAAASVPRGHRPLLTLQEEEERQKQIRAQEDWLREQEAKQPDDAKFADAVCEHFKLYNHLTKARAERAREQDAKVPEPERRRREQALEDRWEAPVPLFEYVMEDSDAEEDSDSSAGPGSGGFEQEEEEEAEAEAEEDASSEDYWINFEHARLCLGCRMGAPPRTDACRIYYQERAEARRKEFVAGVLARGGQW